MGVVSGPEWLGRARLTTATLKDAVLQARQTWYTTCCIHAIDAVWAKLSCMRAYLLALCPVGRSLVAFSRGDLGAGHLQRNSAP